MNKKLVLLLSTTVTASICLGVMMVAVNHDQLFAQGDTVYEMVLADKSKVEEKDDGYYHQISIKNNKFDMVGWSSTGGEFGSIKKDTYGTYEYEGMIYNRSVINGFASLTVKFSGGDLYYVFTDFLMENMDFDKENALVSETPVAVPNNEGYFVVYTDSETAVNIDFVKVTYECDATIDTEMLYNKGTELGGARSWTSKVEKDDSFLVMENNPTQYTNNYSRGNHISEGNDDSWYRFNGRYFKGSGYIGTEFTFGMTVMGEYSRMVDETKFFHYNVWPQLTYEGAASIDENWIQTYIGNDNYEPLGAEHTLFPTDPHALESYEGRFFGDYNYHNDKWMFVDPDEFKIPDESMTLREAYQRYTLPFWFIKFHIYLDEDNDPKYDIYINNMLIYSDSCFYYYDKVNTPAIGIKTVPMHIINYGVDVNATPMESYTGLFTYPRLIA